MPKLYTLLAVIIVWVVTIIGATWVTWDYCSAKADQNRIKAVERTIAETQRINQENREIEKAAQEAINNAIQKQYDDAERRSADLAAQLDELRDRPSRLPRAGTGTGADTDPAGSTGAELSREDAGFLAREAARGDECRSGLKSCYIERDILKNLLKECR